jgi:hypothetical protein
MQALFEFARKPNRRLIFDPREGIIGQRPGRDPLTWRAGMRRSLVGIFLVVLAGVAIPAGLAGKVVSFVNGQATLEGRTADGKSIQLTIQTVPYVNSLPDKGWWGTVDDGVDRPKTVIRSVSVRVAGIEVWIPLSAYCDLADPNDIRFQREGKGFVLLLRGGDAAGSYQAEWHFADSRLQRRRVAHGEFPDQVWEETRYSFLNDNGR